MIQERNDIHQEEGEARQAIVRGLLRTRTKCQGGFSEGEPHTCVQTEGMVPLPALTLLCQGSDRKTMSLMPNASVKEWA